MVVSNANTLEASAAWLAKLGRLDPWEVADANRVVRECAPTALPRLMARLAEQVGKTLREPLHGSDVDIILSTASNVRGLFAGVKDARGMAHAVPDAPRAWTLVLEALDGRSYNELVGLLETKAAKPNRGVRVRPGDRVGLAGMTAHIVGAYVSRNPVKEGNLPGIITDVQMALAGELSGASVEKPPIGLKPAAPVRKSVTPRLSDQTERRQKITNR